MEYRVIIEQWDKDKLEHRVEKRQSCLPEEFVGKPLGTAVAGAVAGMCVYDEPGTFDVVAYTLNAIDFPRVAQPLQAVGEAATSWWEASEEPPEFHDVCKVIVRSGFVRHPTWVTEVSDEVWNSLDAARSAG